MAISTVGGGYRFLPPVIRPDPEAESGTSADTSRAGATRVANAPVVAPATPAVPAPDKDAGQAETARHLLRIVV